MSNLSSPGKEIDHGKINVETNSGTAVSTKTTSLTWRETLRDTDAPLVFSLLTLKKFHNFS